MTLHCKAGNLAVVLYDTPECASNIGRFVRVLGALQFSKSYDKWCWLIDPIGASLWMVDRNGPISAESVSRYSLIEHPDAWLKPIPPDVLDENAERAPATDTRKSTQITT